MSKISNKKRNIILVIIAIVAIIAGFMIYRNKSGNGSQIYVVKKGTVKEELVLTGTVKAEKHAIMSFPAGGKISWIGVSEGQKVQKGQSLISIDKTILNATYQQALNTHKNYQAAAEYALDTVKNHSNDETFAQKTTRTTAEVNRDNAYDAVLAARYNLDNATLKAPFMGIVSALPYTTVGINVLYTDSVVEIVDPASIYFEVEADQNEVTQIRDQQEVDVVLDSFTDKIFKGKVSFVGLTPKTGIGNTAYKIKVRFTGDETIRVGMSGDAKFILSYKENVLYVPSEYINSNKDGKYVFSGGPKKQVKVETGVEGEETIEIKSGVSEGDILYD